MTLANWTQHIHHDGSETFISNPLPSLDETITIKLRTPNHDSIKGIYFRAMINGEFKYIAMEASEESDLTTRWSCDFLVSQSHIAYMFVVLTDVGAVYYTARGASLADSPDTDWFTMIADYDAPLWVRDEVFYQIFPERFANGDESNDIETDEYEVFNHKTLKREWGDMPHPWKQSGSVDFFGGDVNGITQNLDYLADLGITGIYMTPIFESETNHAYDVTNYFAIDKHFGGDTALAELREASAKRQMRLMLDITPNHCSYNHPWVTKFKNNLDGDTSEFFYYDEETNSFEFWLGVPLLVKLNYGSQKLRDVMYRSENSAIRKWLQPPYSIDAWRLDVANMTGNKGQHQLDHEVWRELRESAKQDNPDVYLLGEYFQDGSAHLQGNELDASMNYQGFNMPMRRWLVPPEKQVIVNDNPYKSKPSITAEVMVEQWERFLSAIAYPIALQQFNQLDSHDTTRVLHETFGDKDLVKLGTTLMLAFPGVPCIYYGTEIGMTGGEDPDNRRCMPWDESEWDKDMLAYFQKIIAIRKDSRALKHGSFKVLHAEADVVAFARESTEETLIAVGYRGNDTLNSLTLNVMSAGIVNTTVKDLLSDKEYSVANGQLTITDIRHGQALLLLD